MEEDLEGRKGNTDSETKSGLGPDWSDLTYVCLTNVLSRLSLEQRWTGPLFACKSWFNACKDPSLNSVFDLDSRFESQPESSRWWTSDFERKIDSMIRSVISWSGGSLTEIRTRHCSDGALNFAAERYLFVLLIKFFKIVKEIIGIVCLYLHFSL